MNGGAGFLARRAKPASIRFSMSTILSSTLNQAAHVEIGTTAASADGISRPAQAASLASIVVYGNADRPRPRPCRGAFLSRQPNRIRSTISADRCLRQSIIHRGHGREIDRRRDRTSRSRNSRSDLTPRHAPLPCGSTGRHLHRKQRLRWRCRWRFGMPGCSARIRGFSRGTRKSCARKSCAGTKGPPWQNARPLGPAPGQPLRTSNDHGQPSAT